MSERIDRHAELSSDGQYRYTLERVWDWGADRQLFVMLNPSTADAELDDPTIRRCMSFARRDGWGGICVLNLYALRATDPRELKRAIDPVGALNDTRLRQILGGRADAGRHAVAAWGVNADPARVKTVLELEPRMNWLALGLTKGGHPKHPLYLAGSSELVAYRPGIEPGN